jgi:hypothetical protein
MSLGYKSQRHILLAAIAGVVSLPFAASAATVLPILTSPTFAPAPKKQAADPVSVPATAEVLMSHFELATSSAHTDQLRLPLMDDATFTKKKQDLLPDWSDAWKLTTPASPLSLACEAAPSQMPFDAAIPAPLPGMISLQAIEDIENRVFNRILAEGAGNVTTLTSLYPATHPPCEPARVIVGTVTPIIGSAEWLNQFCGEIPPIAQGIALSGVDRLALKTDQASVQVSSAQLTSELDSVEPAEFVNPTGLNSGAGSGGASGNSSSAVLAAKPSMPVGLASSTPSTATPIAWMPAAHSTHRATPPPAMYASSVTASSMAAPTINASPAAARLPAGLAGFQINDLNPISAAWTFSEATHINAGRLTGLVSNVAGTLTHAALWNINAKGFADLHPTSGMFVSSRINDINGAESVGVGDTGRFNHALLWLNANPSSTVDLNPVGFTSSYALGTTGTQQFGYGYPTATPEVTHALLWNDSAANMVDLNPAGFIFSLASAGDVNHQVGYGQNNLNQLHALAWSGRADSFIDINPTSGAFMDSRAVTLAGNEVGGSGTSINGYQHAILWTALSGDSALDVNPAGFVSSAVNAMSAIGEVGAGRLATDYSGHTHALLWTPDGLGYIDLSNYLPSRYISSEATGIDAAGNIVGFATDSVTGSVHAVEWAATVPEPASLAAIGFIAITFFRPKKRKASFVTN